jgi:TonB family protein
MGQHAPVAIWKLIIAYDISMKSMKTPNLVALGALAFSLTQAAAQQIPAVTTPANDAGTVSLQIGDPIEVGHPTNAKNPAIPKEFRKKNVSVVLHGVLATDGSFKDLEVVGGEPALADPSLDEVRQWTYSACTLHGVSIEVPVFIAFGFRGKNVSRVVEADLPFPTKPSEVKEGTQEMSRVGRGGTTPPRTIYAPDPEYSETARIAKYQGVMTLGMIVGADGIPRDVWVVRKLGLGLDQKAIEAVRRWKFEPATRDGELVAVHINVEVTFHLY